MKRICLITPGHIGSTPRLVKAAHALHEAGYQVETVSCSYFSPIQSWDSAVLSNAPWSAHIVPQRQGSLYKAKKIASQLALHLRPRSSRAGRAVIYNERIQSLYRAALRIQADVYIAHCLSALPAAALAAASTGAAYAFDAEDFHPAELMPSAHTASELAVRHVVLEQYLPNALFVTTASPEMAALYYEHFGITAVSVLNVFPTETNSTEQQEGSYQGHRLYWFSQTIGPHRGIEHVLNAVSLTRSRPHIYLQGLISDAYRRSLTRRAASLGIAECLHFLAPVVPTQMITTARSYDIGISAEERHPLNRDICLTNKIFTYLQAGIPSLLSATRSQRALADVLGAAAQCLDFTQSSRVAARIDELLTDTTWRSACGKAAREAAEKRYNWNEEKQVLLHLAAKALA